ncbi:MAG: hypothetical protein U9Q15_03615 [Patescibacteria group bacterium]|nr:hypothetical protein [Patescibacteria group bacterium]
MGDILYFIGENISVLFILSLILNILLIIRVLTYRSMIGDTPGSLTEIKNIKSKKELEQDRFVDTVMSAAYNYESEKIKEPDDMTIEIHTEKPTPQKNFEDIMQKQLEKHPDSTNEGEDDWMKTEENQREEKWKQINIIK